MTVAIVSSPCPVTLLGGADVRVDDLTTALSFAPTLVAADGGANALLERGHVPEAVIGDLDSLSAAAHRAFAGRIHEIGEQETTDFDKALRSIFAPLVIALGVTGGRLDHELAGLNVLVRYPDRACIALGRETLAFHCPTDLVIDLDAGCVVSLFPMREVGVDSQGLVWPTAGLRLSPDGRIGTSNAATGPIRLRPDGTGLLVILPAGQLRAAVTALQAAQEDGPG